jgi:ELWxxDGT repeat protein
MKKRLPFHKCCASAAWPNIVRVLKLSCLLLIISVSANAQARLIKDLDLREEITYNEYYLLTAGSTQTYFVRAGELWKSSGTPETTLKLKAFRYVSSILVIGNTAYVAADDGSGIELWKSNGTPGGTVRVKDIWPGTDGSNPQELTNVNGIVYFTANNGKNGRELWKTNGSASGTVMVKDILQVTGSSSPTGLTNLNGTLYFSANNGSHGFELWKSNGTAEGTVMVKDIRPDAKVSSSPKFITRSNGMLFFTAIDDTGRELWESDGTEAGTVRVKDIRTGSDADIENLIDVNGTLFFTANDGVHGDELWKSNGTEAGTVLVKDMNPGSAGSNNTNYFSLLPMNNFRNINGKLFFIASQGTQAYIYRSDGTEHGTIRISEAFGTCMNDPKPYFTYMLGYVYFFNVEGSDTGPQYLWKMHINSNTPTRVKEFHTPYSYLDRYYYENYDHSMVQCNNALYIAGRPDGDKGFKLVRSDGTAAGTSVITDTYISTLGSNPSEMISVNGLVFFRTSPDSYDYLYGDTESDGGVDLYRTDGTAAGTYRMPGTFQEWNEMEKVGNALYYTAETGGWELNKTDGTTTSTVTTGSTGEERPIHLTAVGSELYYANWLGQLWKTNGTSAGTVMIKDLYKINSITDVGGKAYVLAETSTGGLELWRTNATGSMFRVKTIRTSAATPSLHNPTAIRGNILYFVANDGIHGNEIWQSDGTATGTFMVYDVNQVDPTEYTEGEFEVDLQSMAFANGFLFFTGTNGYEWSLYTYSVSTKEVRSYYFEGPRDLIAHNNKAFFVSDLHLYVTDGSAAPLLLGDLGVYAQHADYAVIDNLLYVCIAPYSPYIWRTDGTACGTTNIETGIGNTFVIEPVGNDMIIGSHEPYVFPDITEVPSPCSAPAIASSTAGHEESAITPYPNPFTSNFSLRINGNDEETADVGVYTATGMPVEKFEAIKVNTDYTNIGSQWPRGMYIVKVSKGGKLTSHTIIKK